MARKISIARTTKMEIPTDLNPDAINEIAMASLIENWIDETERRTWFLFETVQEL